MGGDLPVVAAKRQLCPTISGNDGRCPKSVLVGRVAPRATRSEDLTFTRDFLRSTARAERRALPFAPSCLWATRPTLGKCHIETWLERLHCRPAGSHSGQARVRIAETRKRHAHFVH